MSSSEKWFGNMANQIISPPLSKLQFAINAGNYIVSTSVSVSTVFAPLNNFASSA
jgi:hypothetical protein